MGTSIKVGSNPRHCERSEAMTEDVAAPVARMSAAACGTSGPDVAALQPQIRLAHIRIAPDLACCTLHQHASGLQDVGAVGDLQALGHALLDDQDRHAGV